MATFHGIGGIILALKAVKAALCAALEAVCKAWYKTKRQKRRTAFLSAALVSVFSEPFIWESSVIIRHLSEQ